jgi:hypothetical protein
METYLNKSKKRVHKEVNTAEDIIENIDTNDYVPGSSISSESRRVARGGCYKCSNTFLNYVILKSLGKNSL